MFDDGPALDEDDVMVKVCVTVLPSALEDGTTTTVVVTVCTKGAAESDAAEIIVVVVIEEDAVVLEAPAVTVANGSLVVVVSVPTRIP